MLIGEEIWFSFERSVLQGVSFELQKGQLIGLIGRNGSGKTTLLRILRNRLQPSRGQVLLKGKPVGRYSRKELARTMGFVLQDHHVGFPLSVMEYVLQSRFAYTDGFGFENARDLDFAEDALRLTNVWDFRDRNVDTLSGGERQRVVLARALAAHPEILLLDEPTANMDLAHQVEMLTLIKQLTEERELVSVFVTHELNLAAEFADRILLLQHGRLLGDGCPREVLTKERLRMVFGCEFDVDMNPFSQAPRITISTVRKNESHQQREA